jgi:hypothetical protein
MAASPIPKVNSRNLVPSGVKWIDRRRDMLRMKENDEEAGRLRDMCFTRIPYSAGRVLKKSASL